MNSIKTKAKTFFVIILAVTMLFAAGCESSKISSNSNDAVAKIGNKVISKDLYNKKLTLIKKTIEDQYGDQIWSLDMGGKTYLQAVQEKVLDQMIDEEAVVKYMKDQNINIDDKEIQKQYEAYMEGMKNKKEAKEFLEQNGIDEAFIKNQMKMDLYMNKFHQKIIEELALTDKKLEEYYEKHKEKYTKDRAKASHILVEKEEEAKDILKKIKAGEDFEELAKKYSKDPGSAAQGGNLGVFPKGMMVPEFEKVAFSLKDGEVSEPVKTQFGYHIIKGMAITFEDVKEEIRMDMIQNAIVDKLKQIKEDLKIERFEENIK
ncbi:hypothetical protein FQB35_01125 [Crassaminicella thermophila]|uniref:peptidylprolyl isomerase n=1 Tax=Crassaminicella thermophila TaxID=2599308 RepID=A0A5C0SC46_CRATE|nr:peptidylprolyl isomerase [Crassaminicella thermophila]QEK11078.1 hypothetical protein FQB35_01125 [Crassaminicella thermophila]